MAKQAYIEKRFNKASRETIEQVNNILAEYNRLYKSSWELDAVEPATLADIVRSAVLKYRDAGKWQKAVMAEKRMKAELQDLANSYEAGE